MSQLVGRCFQGIGVDVNALPFDVKDVKGRNGDYLFTDEVLAGIGAPFEVVDGDGHLYFGISPVFPWRLGKNVKYPKSDDEAKKMVAEALSTVLVGVEGKPVHADEIIGYVKEIEDGWVERW